MRRYWINQKNINQNLVFFEAEAFHHIFEVCRQEVGSRFEVITEDAKAYLVEVTEKFKKKASAKIIEQRQIKTLKPPYIHLALSIPKYSTMENVLEKAVELGVSSLQPLICDFSFVKHYSENEWSRKSERWKKIIVSATQQSGRGDLLKMEPPKALALFTQEMNRNPNSICLMFYEGKSENNVRQQINKLKKNATQPIENIWIIIGSEGGFSDHEVELLLSQGLSPVTLGDQILRVETACIATISVLKYEFDLMGEF